MNNRAFMAMTVLGGLLSAALSLLHLFPIPGIALISYFASLPLFLLGLGIGLRPLYGAGLIATALVLFVAGPIVSAEFFVFSVVGPALILSRALLNRKSSSGKISWYPSSLLLRDLTYMSGGIMLLALAAYIYLMQGNNVTDLVRTLFEALDPQNHMREMEPVFVKIFPLLPGFFAFSWTIMMLINASFAQGLLIRFKRNLRPSPSFEDLDAPKSFLILLGLSLLLSLVGVGYVELLGKNASFVLIFPFFLIGLGLIHQWFHKSKFSTAGLTIFYFLLFVFLWPAIFVILLGILKPWLEKLTLAK